MTPHPLPVERVDQAIKAIRALGAHRYVAGRLHLVHAFALASIEDDAEGVLAQARPWAYQILSDRRVDAGSRDESLWRRVSDAELGAVLSAFWTPGPRAEGARDYLLDLLERHEVRLDPREPFDEDDEDDIHPLLIDAGWELIPLSALDPVRHAGCIAAFETPLALESARFEEETAIPAAPPALYELPAIGPIELLRGADDDGAMTEPLVVWAQGNPTYLDYVMRGVRRAAGIEGV
jgi:hypothetical protein